MGRAGVRRRYWEWGRTREEGRRRQHHLSHQQRPLSRRPSLPRLRHKLSRHVRYRSSLPSQLLLQPPAPNPFHRLHSPPLVPPPPPLRLQPHNPPPTRRRNASVRNSLLVSHSCSRRNGGRRKGEESVRWDCRISWQGCERRCEGSCCTEVLEGPYVDAGGEADICAFSDCSSPHLPVARSEVLLEVSDSQAADARR